MIKLRIPVGTDVSGNRQFRLDPNHLHIWLRLWMLGMIREETLLDDFDQNP